LTIKLSEITLIFKVIYMRERFSGILVEFYEKMSSWENGIVSDRDVSLPQVHLLEVVGNNGQLRMKELSEKLGVTTGTLTVMVHRLIKKGYVAKKNDDKDKRSYFISLTKKGKKEYDNHHRMHGHLIEEIVEAIGEDESQKFFQQLAAIQGLM